MIRKYIYGITILLTMSSSAVDAQLIFNSLDSLLYYANQKSTTIKSGYIKFSQAQQAKLAAVAGIADINGSVTFNITNNTRLPVSLFPAEIFGGTPETYREVQTGVQYTNNFNQYIEIKLLNLSGWQNLKLAKINVDFTSTNNILNKKNLYENIAATYYNVLTLQEQLQSTNENVNAADTLYQIVKINFIWV